MKTLLTSIRATFTGVADNKQFTTTYVALLAVVLTVLIVR